MVSATDAGYHRGGLYPGFHYVHGALGADSSYLPTATVMGIGAAHLMGRDSGAMANYRAALCRFGDSHHRRMWAWLHGTGCQESVWRAPF